MTKEKTVMWKGYKKHPRDNNDEIRINYAISEGSLVDSTSGITNLNHH